MKIQRNTLA